MFLCVCAIYMYVLVKCVCAHMHLHKCMQTPTRVLLESKCSIRPEEVIGSPGAGGTGDCVLPNTDAED